MAKLWEGHQTVRPEPRGERGCGTPAEEGSSLEGVDLNQNLVKSYSVDKHTGEEKAFLTQGFV